jgi:uncharacterized protein involved in outer membrane biogenesis
MSLYEQRKSGASAFLAGARERVIADFRQFRFSWKGFWRWTSTVVAAVLAAALITLYFLDWNELRGPIAQYLSHRYRREVRIDGNLEVNLFTLQPRIDVAGVYIGNPAGEKRPQAANIPHARLEARLLPLLSGHLILALVAIDRPDVLVVRAADGRTNWGIFNSNGSAWQLPPIHRFQVNNGHVEIDDSMRNLNFTGTINSHEESGSQAGFRLDGNGTLNGNKFLANVQGGPLLNVDESRPYVFTADVHAGDTHIVIDGNVIHPFHLDRYVAGVTITGPNLSELYYLTGLALPGTPPYRIHGNFQRDETQYRFDDISGTLGNTDISGDLAVDASNKIPQLTGRLASRQLSFDDLGALFGGGKAAQSQSKYLLPDMPLHTERLRQMNAEVDYNAVAVKSHDFPLRGFDTHISLQSGVLDLKPLAFAFTQGRLSGELRIDARGDVPVTGVDVRLTDIHFESFIKDIEKPLTGTVEARLKLEGRGRSVHEAAAGADGLVTAVIPSGNMRQSLAEWLGVNVISALGLTLSGDKSNTRLRCAVANFDTKGGVMTARQFVLDTDPVRVDVKGSVDLRNETVDLTLAGKPKNFQLLRVRAPVTISGSLGAPTLGVDMKPALVQTGIGVALGLLLPPAAILAFIDPGLAKDANCAGILTDAKDEGAPVNARALRQAAPVRK